MFKKRKKVNAVPEIADLWSLEGERSAFLAEHMTEELENTLEACTGAFYQTEQKLMAAEVRYACRYRAAIAAQN